MAKESSNAKSSGNFFQNLIDSLFGGNDPEAAKKRQLKSIWKTLSKSKYHFYKNSAHEVDPAFAKYFYEIYKVISPAQLMFQNSTPAALKKIVLDVSMTKEQREAYDLLSESAITEQSKKIGIKELSEKTKQTLEGLLSQFDNSTIAKIDNLYTKLMLLSNFCQYDFYFLLKKFDGNVKEHNFSYTPNFRPITGTYVAEDIKNFIAVAWCIPFEADWEDVFKLLRAVKGVEPITLAVWKKVMARLRQLRERRVLEMMVQLITEEPNWREVPKSEDFRIVDDFISETRKQVETTLANLKARQTAGKIDSLLSQVFSGDVEPLKNYNTANSAVFERKDYDGYLYAEPLSYLKQFLLDYTKKEIRELSDILLVRGDWANQQLATPMSDAYHQLLEVSEKIAALDARMSEDGGELGYKLKNLLPRAERDKEAKGIIKTTLKDANNAAARLIITAVQYYVSYDRNLKMCLEDFVKMPRSELVLNWRELDHFAEGRLKEMCVEAYKKIYAFVQLMQNFQVNVEED